MQCDDGPFRSRHQCALPVGGLARNGWGVLKRAPLGTEAEDRQQDRPEMESVPPEAESLGLAVGR